MTIKTVIVSDQGILISKPEGIAEFSKVVKFDNGLGLDEAIKECARKAVSTVALISSPYTLNRNILTNGVNELTVIIKTSAEDFKTDLRMFSFMRDNKFYQDIKEIL